MKKNIIKILWIAIIAILGYIFLIKPDYSWADKTIESQTKEGWTLITQSESGALVKPWTLFRTPVTSLWFVKKHEIFRIDSSNIAGLVLFTSHNFYKTEYFKHIEVYNCALKKSFVLGDVADLKTFDPKKQIWFEQNIGTPGGDLLNYFCSRNKKYTTLNIFGEEIDISNYIISEKYSLVDSSKYIFEIRNNNPYVPNAKDEIIIREAILKWLSENYPNQNYAIPKDIYSISKYLTSQVYLVIPNDIFAVEFTPNAKIGKILLEFDFTRDYLPDQNDETNEVRILHAQ